MDSKQIKMKKIVVLVSGGGSNLQALIDAVRPPQGQEEERPETRGSEEPEKRGSAEKEPGRRGNEEAEKKGGEEEKPGKRGKECIPAQISRVISDTKDAFALKRASLAGIEAIELDKRDKNRFSSKEAFNRALLEEIHEGTPDWIVLAGFLSILPAAVIEAYRNRIINIHPSLIPKYAGMGFYGHKVHEAVIAAGEKESGATVHFVDEGVDTGQIIIQEKVHIEKEDTPDTLAAKVLAVEHRILPEAVRRLCAGPAAWER